MDSTQLSNFLHGERIDFSGTKSTSKAYAEHLDSTDSLKHFRNEFLIPTKAELREPHPEARPLDEQNDPSDACIYLCGNSLGLQPKCLRFFVNEELSIWATKGVSGHFLHPQSRPWVSAADQVAHDMSKLVGALPSEVAVMGSLTENIHTLFASFYKPDGKRTKVIIEGKAFPSDHYAVESQIEWNKLNPKEHLVCIEPAPGYYALTTDQILKVIDMHARDTAVLFLPGVQFYTGQAFDIKTITRHAQSKGLLVGWDLAHAVGNVPLELHEWGVDFASWCTYKYLCSGPGGMSSIFIHDRHNASHRHRLAGWWGHDPHTRFHMDNTFKPAPGAAGYQLSNPSILSLTALRASLSVFTSASMAALRTKSVHLTNYLEHLLNTAFPPGNAGNKAYDIITPGDPQQRGAQLSIKFREPERMMSVLEVLREEGVVVDERRPDVIRVAPAPMWNTFVEVWTFVEIFREAVEKGEVGH